MYSDDFKICLGSGGALITVSCNEFHVSTILLQKLWSLVLNYALGLKSFSE